MSCLYTSVISSIIIIAQLSRKEVTRFVPPESELMPRLLGLKWVGEGDKPQSMEQKVVLKGSEDTKFLTIYQPPIPIGMSEMMRSRVH